MQRVFDARRAAARCRGAGRAQLFTVLALGDVVVSGVIERISGRPWPTARKGLAMTWDTCKADARFAWRLMRHSPMFAGLSILALALGIGANGAIFAAVDNVLLRPLPYGHAQDLVMVWSDNTHERHDRNPVSPADFLDFKNRNQSFSAFEPMLSFLSTATYRDGENVESVQASTIGTSLFWALGRDALVGRTFTDTDVAPVAVLSYGFWQRRYGGDRSVIGKTVMISNVPGTIVGVMPDDFVFPYRSMLGPTGFVRAQAADVWLPLRFTGGFFVDANGQPPRPVRFLGVVGRLKTGVTAEAARADLSAIATTLAQDFPASNSGWGVTVVPLHEQAVGAIRPALLLLLAGVGVVLLMACTNVANLVLARSVARQRELAVRAALGASRGRLIQQALIESVILSAGGAIVGAVLLYGGIEAIVSLAPPDTPRLAEIRPTAGVFGFTFAVAALASLFVGLLPAWTTSKSDIQAALKDGTRATTPGPARRRLRAALVIGEVALAVLLTTSATLLLRSFVTVLAVDPGFKPEHLLTLQINAPARIGTRAALLQYYTELFDRLDQVPGVVSTGGTTRLPLGSTNVSTSIAVEGRDVAAASQPEVEMRRAAHRYFETMGIPVLAGRAFTNGDSPIVPPVCVINHAMQQRVFPGEDPVGRRIKMGPNPQVPWITIVGVIGDIRHGSLEEAPRAEVYLSSEQNPPSSPFIVLRTTGDPAAMVESVRSAVRAVDATTPIFDLRAMTAIRSESVSERRFTMLLVAIFGVLALTLAAVGVYGVMALVVSERTAEVGVRLAMGATPGQILGLMLGHALTLGGIGIAVGLAAALIATPFMTSLLFGVRPADPASMAVVVVTLAAVAMVAAIVPARRAMRVDPIAALRSS